MTIDNSVVIDAPFDTVWAMTNDVESWPGLFTEYASAQILEQGDDSILFRLTTVADADGKVWSWVSRRWADRATRSVRAQRVETGPFEFMHINWDYEQTETGVKMRWRQRFAVKPGSGWSEESARDRLDTTTKEQMQHIRSVLEKTVREGEPA